jgi:hypothetical protein
MKPEHHSVNPQKASVLSIPTQFSACDMIILKELNMSLDTTEPELIPNPTYTSVKPKTRNPYL